MNTKLQLLLAFLETSSLPANVVEEHILLALASKMVRSLLIFGSDTTLHICSFVRSSHIKGDGLGM